MTPVLRVIDTGLRPARWNVAATAALAELHAAGRIPDTLRFHGYRRCVLLGRHQEFSQAADLAFCGERGIDIARRITGGGAVYMSPGVLAWDVVMPRRSLGALDGAAAKICGAVAAGLSRLGLPARFEAPNAIGIGGRKISGASGYAESSSLVHQGTVLVDADFSEMAVALAVPAGRLRGRLVTLREALGHAPDMRLVKDAIGAAMAEAFRRPLANGVLTTHELDLIAELHAGLGSDAFVEDGEWPEPFAAPRAASFAEDVRP